MSDVRRGDTVAFDTPLYGTVEGTAGATGSDGNVLVVVPPGGPDRPYGGRWRVPKDQLRVTAPDPRDAEIATLRAENERLAALVRGWCADAVGLSASPLLRAEVVLANSRQCTLDGHSTRPSIPTAEQIAGAIVAAVDEAVLVEVFARKRMYGICVEPGCEERRIAENEYCVRHNGGTR